MKLQRAQRDTTAEDDLEAKLAEVEKREYQEQLGELKQFLQESETEQKLFWPETLNRLITFMLMKRQMDLRMQLRNLKNTLSLVMLHLEKAKEVLSQR